MSSTRHRGRWTPDDRAAEQYRSLPFDVPAGATRVRVTLDYDRTAAVLDLGCLAPGGFRGWSGSARDGFTITRLAATPGYLPGELEPGTWHVLLGLHRIPAGGLAYEATAEVDPPGAPPPTPPQPDVPPPAERPPRRRLPALGGLDWLAGDFHAHTVHSDGALTVAALAALAVARGLDFLAVTDHNTTSHHAELARAGGLAGIRLVPGQEVTTDRGHANGLGDVGWIDFRAPAADWLDAVESRGGLLSVNHPLAADCCWRQELPRRAPLAEIWHSSWWDRRWGGPLAWWQAWGIDVLPIGGSDFHRPGADAPPGSPTTGVGAEPEDVLGGVRRGRGAVRADRGGPVLLRLGDDLVAVDADGTLLTGPDGRRRPVRGGLATFPAQPGPHWLEDGETRVFAVSP